MKEDNAGYRQADQAQEESSAIPSWVYGRQERVRDPGHVGGKGYLLKRPFDIFVAFVGLLIASPLWLVFAIAIKLEDRGPILFLQDRWGKDKGKIRVFKFRTMVPNAVERFGNMQAQENDPRVTKVGRFLRATSLDEMPQLLNIAKGDMSWVGPRALPIDEIQVREEGGGTCPMKPSPALRPGQSYVQGSPALPRSSPQGTYPGSRNTSTTPFTPAARASGSTSALSSCHC